MSRWRRRLRKVSQSYSQLTSTPLKVRMCAPDATVGLTVVLHGVPASQTKSGGYGTRPLKLQAATTLSRVVHAMKVPSGDAHADGGRARLQ